MTGPAVQDTPARRPRRMGVIIAVGLLSGVYPAWKAGRIRPLEAIRGEVGK